MLKKLYKIVKTGISSFNSGYKGYQQNFNAFVDEIRFKATHKTHDRKASNNRTRSNRLNKRDDFTQIYLPKDATYTLIDNVLGTEIKEIYIDHFYTRQQNTDGQMLEQVRPNQKTPQIKQQAPQSPKKMLTQDEFTKLEQLLKEFEEQYQPKPNLTDALYADDLYADNPYPTSQNTIDQQPQDKIDPKDDFDDFKYGFNRSIEEKLKQLESFYSQQLSRDHPEEIHKILRPKRRLKKDLIRKPHIPLRSHMTSQMTPHTKPHKIYPPINIDDKTLIRPKYFPRPKIQAFKPETIKRKQLRF